MYHHALNLPEFFFVAHDYDADEFSKGFKRSMSFLRTYLSKRMTTRGIPRLEFIYDKSFDESYKIDQLIKKSLG
jgi:ribosome-binding factor A